MIGLAENIYLWRIFKGLSQGELAKGAGIPRPNLSAIETGKREPSLLTLRLLAVCLKTTPGVLINGIPPVDFKKSGLSRHSLETIAEISAGKIISRISPQHKAISNLLSGIIKNKINAKNKIYRNITKNRHTYINNWLMLKAAIGRDILNNLSARLDKKILIS